MQIQHIFLGACCCTRILSDVAAGEHPFLDPEVFCGHSRRVQTVTMLKRKQVPK